jgi:hypothetical protein
MYKQQSSLLRFFSKAGGVRQDSAQPEVNKTGIVSCVEGPQCEPRAADCNPIANKNRDQRKRHADADLPGQAHQTRRLDLSRKEKIKEKLAGGGSEEQSLRSPHSFLSYSCAWNLHSV